MEERDRTGSADQQGVELRGGVGMMGPERGRGSQAWERGYDRGRDDNGRDVLKRVLGAWDWGHTQGGPRAEPLPREEGGCGATGAFLSRLQPGATEAPALPRLSSAPPEFASCAGPLTVPCPLEGTPASRARAPAYLFSSRRAPEATPTPPCPARPRPFPRPFPARRVLCPPVATRKVPCC